MTYLRHELILIGRLLNQPNDVTTRSIPTTFCNVGPVANLFLRVFPTINGTLFDQIPPITSLFINFLNSFECGHTGILRNFARIFNGLTGLLIMLGSRHGHGFGYSRPEIGPGYNRAGCTDGGPGPFGRNVGTKRCFDGSGYFCGDFDGAGCRYLVL